MKNGNIRKGTTDILVSVLIYIFLGAFGTQLSKMPDTAVWYPRFFLFGALLLNTAVFIQNLRAVKNTRITLDFNQCKSKIFILLFYTVLCGIYIFLIPITGYLLTTFIFLIIMLLSVGIRSLRTLILLPLISTASVYVLFTYVLVVLLPSGSIFH